jgi:hypothetical protein
MGLYRGAVNNDILSDSPPPAASFPATSLQADFSIWAVMGKVPGVAGFGSAELSVSRRTPLRYPSVSGILGGGEGSETPDHAEASL